MKKRIKKLIKQEWMERAFIKRKHFSTTLLYRCSPSYYKNNEEGC